MPSPDPRQEQFENLTDPAQIAGLLRRLQEGQVLLSIALRGERPLYNSAVLAVDPEQEQLRLDALRPHDANPLLRQGSRLQAFARLHGVELSFVLELQGVPDDDGACTAGLPERMHYHQRRQQYRVRVSGMEPPPVELTLADQSRCTAELVDLSAGGLCLRCSRDAIAGAEPGAVLPSMRLTLPDLPRLDCAVEVRNIRHDPATGTALIGARFLGLDRRLTQQVQRFVAAMDREARKRVRHVR